MVYVFIEKNSYISGSAQLTPVFQGPTVQAIRVKMKLIW